GVPVFKVFNGIFWKHLLEGGLPRGSAGRIALPIAGDDAAGKQIVSDLVDELGFDPVDAGTLAESWRQQPGTPVYGTDLDAEGAKKALAEASPERPEGFRLAAFGGTSGGRLPAWRIGATEKPHDRPAPGASGPRRSAAAGRLRG